MIRASRCPPRAAAAHRAREHRVVVAQRRRLEALGVLGPLAPLGDGVSERRLPVGLHVDERALGLVDQRVHRPLRRPAIQIALRRSAAARPPAAGSVGLHPRPAEPPVVLPAGRVAPLGDRVDDLGRAALARPEQDRADWLLAGSRTHSLNRRYHGATSGATTLDPISASECPVTMGFPLISSEINGRTDNCHAEGRGFESLQPLGTKALQIAGFFRCAGAAVAVIGP